MHESVFDRVEKLLASQNLPFSVSRHQPVYTSEEAAAVRGVPLSTGAKALICKGGDQFVMFVIIPGDQAWLMDSALHRLLLHGFPSALLVVWTLVRPVGVVRDSGPGGSPPQ